MKVYKIQEIKDILKAYKVFKLGTNHFSAQFDIMDSTELSCRENVTNNLPGFKIIHFEKSGDFCRYCFDIACKKRVCSPSDPISKKL